MKREELYDGITDIRDDLVDQAQKPKKHFSKKRQLAAAVAVLAVIAAGAATLQSHNLQSYNRQTAAAGVIAKADYPKTAPYPNQEAYYNEDGSYDSEGFSKEFDIWWADGRARRDLTGYEDSVDAFLTKSAGQFLSDEKGENRIYAPLNVYMALSMLAELTDGDSRGQILELLGSKDIAALRKQASDLWNANYCNDGATTSILASSLWLNQDINFVQSTMDTLAKTYYASSYQGEMGSDAFNKCLQNWLNEQTGGLLEEQAAEQKLEPDTILALATTIYFRTKWEDEFLTNNTKEETFHAKDGDVVCDFMRQDEYSAMLYWGEKFSAVAKSFKHFGDMLFILPDEGVSVDELLSDGQAMEFLSTRDRLKWKNRKDMLVNLSVPKFDVSCKYDLREGLKALGITDVFDVETSDFSPMTKDTNEIYLSEVDHAVRVAIDEEGVTAAAYTAMTMDGFGMPMGEKIDFVLDRPFLFAITGDDGLPLFVGVVNHP